MVNILNLETSALACSVSIGQNGETLISKSSDGEWKHSREITILIQECLNDSDLTFNDIQAIAISGGPGSYTGLRVGASAAKGICYAKNIELIAVNTLEIIAFPYLSKIQSNGFIIPLIDARRNEVYYNVYDKDLKAQLETTNLILDSSSFDKYASSHVIICGDGAEKSIGLIDKPQFKYYPSKSLATHMCKLSYNKFMSQSFEDIAYYSPFYLKLPNITKSKKQLF